MSYDRTIFLSADTEMSNERLAALISRTYGREGKAKFFVEGNRVEVRWDNWSLRVYYETGPDVLR